MYRRTFQDEERLIPELSTDNNNFTDIVDYSTAVSVASISQVISDQPVAGKRFSILEPPVLINFIALFLAGAVMQNQILFQTCMTVYHYNESECEPLQGVVPKTEEVKLIENELQPYVARIIMCRSLLSSFFPALLSLFIGPWSDKFGRRPILLLTHFAALIGYVITTTLIIISSIIPTNPWIYLVADMPSAITGGGCATTVMVLCYVSDVTNDENKAKRLFLIDAAMGTGLIIGNISSNFLLMATNTITVLGVSSVLSLLAFMYIFVFVKESLKVVSTPAESKLRSFFKFNLIKDLIRTCLARRPNYDRAIIWFAMSSCIISSFILQGESNVFYLFLRNKFNVTLKDFTQHNAIVVCIKMVGCVSALILLRKFVKAPLTVIAMLGLGGSVLESAVRATAQEFWEIYLSACLGSFGGITGPMLQAILSVMVPTSEFGKICALLSSLQTITSLGSAPLYTILYNLTLDSYPGLFNVVSAILYLLCFIFITYVDFILLKL